MLTILYSLMSILLNCYEQLLNQMEGAGPAPADSERIEALPKVIITQELVGEYSLSLNEFYYRLSQFISIYSQTCTCI